MEFYIFRIHGLPHSEVGQAEEGRVRHLVDKIEAHPHKEDLQADLRQENVCNPFSENSKKNIYDLGNVEHFQLCDMVSKVQCSYCLSYWAQGILYCTWGLCLNITEEVRKLKQGRFDALSISNWIIRMKSVHGARHGKSEEQIYYYQSFKAWKRCRTKTDESGIHFSGVRERFLKDATYHKSQQKLGWTEATCKEMDDLAQKDDTH